MYKRLVGALLTAILAGCATQPLSDAEATAVQAQAILAADLTTPQAGRQPVTIKRDSGASAGACSTRVFVNGRPAADIRASEKVIVYLPPGDHMFGARANGICAGGMVETRISLRPGARQSLRVGYGSSGEFFIAPTAF